jgi:hypothetical protein
MISFAAGVAAGLLFMQGAINAPRQALMECLKRASLTAAAQNVAADQYGAFATQQCTAAAASFKNALIAFDTKNGVKRAQAASDAQLQVDDYVAMSAEKYESKVGVKAKPAATPAPTPAQAPQQSQSSN